MTMRYQMAISTFRFADHPLTLGLMSTSEMRRGPGWWLDPEGEWKPPEQWPESTPPLPGWTRNADGLWSNEAMNELDTPAEEDLAIDSPSISDDAPVTETPRIDDAPVAETPPKSEASAGLGLTYSTDAVTGIVESSTGPLPERAIRAAVAAAVIAAMLGTGIVLLILL